MVACFIVCLVIFCKIMVGWYSPAGILEAFILKWFASFFSESQEALLIHNWFSILSAPSASCGSLGTRFPTFWVCLPSEAQISGHKFLLLLFLDSGTALSNMIATSCVWLVKLSKITHSFSVTLATFPEINSSMLRAATSSDSREREHYHHCRHSYWTALFSNVMGVQWCVKECALEE